MCIILPLTGWWQICQHPRVTHATRPIAWIKAARRDFEDFPQEAKDDLLDALTVIADGGKPAIAKPLTGLGSGVMELALRHRGDAYRVVYALQVAHEIWVIHAFQKKSKVGIKTPKAEIDLVIERLKRLKEAL
jgi:phage-related protein